MSSSSSPMSAMSGSQETPVVATIVVSPCGIVRILIRIVFGVQLCIRPNIRRKVLVASVERN